MYKKGLISFDHVMHANDSLSNKLKYYANILKLIARHFLIKDVSIIFHSYSKKKKKIHSSKFLKLKKKHKNKSFCFYTNLNRTKIFSLNDKKILLLLKEKIFL